MNDADNSAYTPPLAREIRARDILIRRSPRASRPYDRLGRRAKLYRAQLHARRDEEGRPGVLLSLQRRSHGGRRRGRGGEGGISRSDGAGSEGPASRPEEQGGHAEL